MEATQLSPGGEWLVVRCGYAHIQDLEIVNKEGHRWVLQFKDYLAEEALFPDGELPMGGLYPIHWTHDDAYFYFYPHINYSGGGGCFYRYFMQGLFRINLDSGAVSTVLPATSLGEGYEVSFSPDGRWMVYIQRRPVLVNLQTGEETTIGIGDDHAGNFFWSPDSSALVFTTCRDSKEDGSIIQSAINVYSLASNDLSRLLVVQKQFLRIEKWDENNVLRIVNREEKTEKNNYIYYDWSVGQFVTPTPTTQP